LGERKKGRTPKLLLLTDGQANVARDGSPGRPQAGADALIIAGHIAASNIGAVHIDISVRPRPGANALAQRMGAHYAHLPNPRSADLALLASLSG
jgi:magnesium chelatase subunit D